MAHRSKLIVLATVVALGLPVGGAQAVERTDQSSSTRARVCDFAHIGTTYRWVKLKNHRYDITHALRRRIPRGGKFTISKTVQKIDRSKSFFKAKADIQAEAGKFFAKVEVKLNLSVAYKNQETTNRSVTEKFFVPKRDRPKRWVYYSGVDYYRLVWHRKHCSGSSGYPIYKNSNGMGTWSKARFAGVASCPHTKYRKGSEARAATLAGGC